MPFAAFANNSTKDLHTPRIYKCEAGGSTLRWDEPTRLLSVGDAAVAAVSLPLDSLHAFVAALSRLDDEAMTSLIDGLEEAVGELERWRGEPPWPAALRESLTTLALYSIAARKKNRPAALLRAAKHFAARMPIDSPSASWQVVARIDLPFSHRIGVLETAMEVAGSFPSPELVWWTAKCRLDVAIEWAAACLPDDADAVRKLTEAAAAYTDLLRCEPNRRAMEMFFAAMGTSSEDEVLRAHAACETHAGTDDIVRADLVSWLLRRYSLGKAASLLRKSLRPVEWIGAAAAAMAAAYGIMLFLLHENPRAQVVAQLVAFLLLVCFSRRVYALLLPRAMFGTLLAWITVVLAQMASLLPIADDHSRLRGDLHVWLVNVIQPAVHVKDWLARITEAHSLFVRPAEVVDFIVIVAVCVAVSAMFLMVEVGNRLAGNIAIRSFVCVIVMLMGSLFWGAMFAPALQYIVVREDESGITCACMYPAWLLGSVGAVAFGILVQLIWDDHALSDPVGAGTGR